MAIENINNKTDGLYDDILPQTQLKTIFRPCPNTFFSGSMNAHDLLQVDPTVPLMANIGPFGNQALKGAVPTFLDTPVFDFHDRSAVFGQSANYPNFLRTIPAIYEDGHAAASLISKYFHWEKVSVFYSRTDSSRGSFLTFSYYASLFGIRIRSSHILRRSTDDVSGLIHAAKRSGSRIFILFLDPSKAKLVIEQGMELKLFNSETQIVGGEELSTLSAWNSMNLSSSTMSTLLRGIIGVKFRRTASSGPHLDKFLENWKNQEPTNGSIDANGTIICNPDMDSYGSAYLYQFYPNTTSTTPVCAGVDYSSASSSGFSERLQEVIYAYDATVSVALGLHELVYVANNQQPTPSDLYAALLHNVSFEGLTGRVSFSTEMETDLFNIGGRATELLYDIVNYIESEQGFVPILQWHSENGFTPCGEMREYRADNPCHKFEFQTNGVPSDSPPTEVKEMTSWQNLVLIIISAIGFFSCVVVVLIFSLFSARRLVKMSQPALANLKRFGIFLGFVSVLLATFEPTSGLCTSILWLEHVGFQLIFATISVRCWRVYLVTGSMKRTKVTDRRCLLMILGCVSVMALLLTIYTLLGGDSVSFVTISDNQYEHILERVCRHSSPPFAYAMDAFDLLVLLTGLTFCYLIRKVNSAISNTAALLEGSSVLSLSPSLSCPLLQPFLGISVSLVTFLVIKLVFAPANIEPILRDYLVNLILALLLLRLLWIFESQIIYQLFAGYELDRTLLLQKSQKSLLEMLGNYSKKVYMEPKSLTDNNSSSISHLPGASDVLTAPGMAFVMKGLEKFARMRDRDEIIAEIKRVKEEKEMRQIEFNCLENLLFAVDRESESAKSNSTNEPRRSFAAAADGALVTAGGTPQLRDIENACNVKTFS